MGEACAPSAATDIIARIVPANERSRAVAFVFSGLQMGSVLCLLFAPWIIDEFGWAAMFFSFGVIGAVWCLWFEGLVAELQRSDPDVVAMMTGKQTTKGSRQRAKEAASAAAAAAESGNSGGGHHAALIDADLPIPWRAFLRSSPVRGLMFTHFCSGWLRFTVLAWLPTYFVDTMSVDLIHAGQTALLPPLFSVAVGSAAGSLADTLVSSGVPVARVRKGAQCTSFLGAAFFLVMASLPSVSDNSTLTVASITMALGISSFSLAGLYCTHQDMSPKYASALLSLTNTANSIPGILGVSTVGFLLDTTQASWGL